MNSKKSDFVKDAVQMVFDICKLLFNIQSEKDLQKVFGVTDEELIKIIENVVQGLPENIFDQATQKLEEIKCIFAREFIFFQVQEKSECHEPQYQQDLSQFISVFSRDIQRRIMERSNQT